MPVPRSLAEYQGSIREAASELRDFVAGCSESAWLEPVPGDGRPVGVLSHHIATGIDLSAQWLAAVRSGLPLPGALTFEENDQRNQEHAARNAKTRPADVLELLAATAPNLQSQVTATPAGSLDELASVNEMFGRRWTIRGLLEVSLGHITGHLADLRAVAANTTNA